MALGCIMIKAMDDATPSQQPVRVDRWLWAARMFKTRSQAHKACAAGRVKVNGDTAKAAKTVRPGDRVEATTPGGPRVLEVAGLSHKRGPAEQARKLYVDHTPPPEKRDEQQFVNRDRGAGRPSKRERRILIRARGR